MLQKVSTAVERRVNPVARFHLKTRQLAFLVHLDEERCLARAAEASGLTQPAASKLLRQVEVTLGVQLFERHPRGMSPTGYGEILVRHARTALSQLGLARKEIAALKSGLSGKAAIGMVVDPQSNLLPMAIARLKQRHPGVLVSIEIDPCKQLIQRLLQGDLDMVVGNVLDTARADDLVDESLSANECYVIVAGPANPLAGRKALQLSSLVEQPWILPPTGSLARDKLNAMFVQTAWQRRRTSWRPRLCPLSPACFSTVTWWRRCPRGPCNRSCKAGDLTVLVRNLPLRVGTFGLITRQGQPASRPGAHLMLKTLRELGCQLHAVDDPSPVVVPTSSHLAADVRQARCA